MITLSQLRAFDAVARHRHFTRAAEELQIAQPSVGYQVRTLERTLKVKLIEVVGRQVYLTDAGERLAARATALLNEIDDLEREMRDHGTGVLGRLRLGATRTIGGYALADVLAAFHASHPRIELKLTIHNTRTIEELVLNRSIDLGIVEGRVASTDLSIRPLRRDSLVLIVPPRHHFAARSSIARDELIGQPF